MPGELQWEQVAPVGRGQAGPVREEPALVLWESDEVAHSPLPVDLLLREAEVAARPALVPWWAEAVD